MQLWIAALQEVFELFGDRYKESRQYLQGTADRAKKAGPAEQKELIREIRNRIDHGYPVMDSWIVQPMYTILSAAEEAILSDK